jgi:hypothetical protein
VPKTADAVLVSILHARIVDSRLLAASVFPWVVDRHRHRHHTCADSRARVRAPSHVGMHVATIGEEVRASESMGAVRASGCDMRRSVLMFRGFGS